METGRKLMDTVGGARKGGGRQSGPKVEAEIKGQRTGRRVLGQHCRKERPEDDDDRNLRCPLTVTQITRLQDCLASVSGRVNKSAHVRAQGLVSYAKVLCEPAHRTAGERLGRVLLKSA